MFFEDRFCHHVVDAGDLAELLDVVDLVSCDAAEEGELNGFIFLARLRLNDDVPNLPDALKAIHLRHAVVDHDELVDLQIGSVETILDHPDCLGTTRGRAGRQTELLQQPKDCLRIQVVVVDDQNLTTFIILFIHLLNDSLAIIICLVVFHVMFISVEVFHGLNLV